MNVVAVRGRLSSQPVTHELQSGSVLVSLELTTRVDDAAASVPLVWFDPPSPVAVVEGDEIAAVGSVRRRFYRTGGSTQSRTEVVVALLARSNDKRAMARQRKWLSSAMGAEGVDGLRSS
jgi:single-strand DNA-binding protein